jgi:hypothetical protein
VAGCGVRAARHADRNAVGTPQPPPSAITRAITRVITREPVAGLSTARRPEMRAQLRSRAGRITNARRSRKFS